MEDRIYDYWASTLQDGYIGNIVNIVDRAGGAKMLYGMGKDAMVSKLCITPRLAAYIEGNRPSEDAIRSGYEGLNEKDIRFICHTDADFPEKLVNIPSPPYGLFVKGNLPDPAKPSVAIVGSRQCSEYGRLMARFLGERLAAEGVQIISGMAWGIDGIAQLAALSAGGRSFAILGCGVDITYPVKNAILYRRLCRQKNGVISEYAPSTPASARQFPPRNRLISGLCDVLVVVEARVKSGTLITVDMANDQGKTVMAVPGRLTDSLSAGCLNLLDQGAFPVTGIKSVLDQLGMISPGCPERSTDPEIPKDPRIPPDLRSVGDVLGLDPLGVDEIAQQAGKDVKTTLMMLTKLEMAGLAKEVTPGSFIKNVTG